MTKKSKPTITYAITACDEYHYLEILLTSFKEVGIKDGNELIVQLDSENTNDKMRKLCQSYEESLGLKVIEFPLNNNFATFKNNLRKHSTKDYIFQIDADEIPGYNLLNNLNEYLSNAEDIDVIYVSRINIVERITLDYIKEQNWVAQDNPFPIKKHFDEKIINWPDLQGRIYKNNPNISWEGKVHESVKGNKDFAVILDSISNISNNKNQIYEKMENWSLLHIKEFERQKKQNEYYASAFTDPK